MTILTTQNPSGILRLAKLSRILRYKQITQTTRPCDSQQKRGTCRIVNFAVPADPIVKLGESKKRDKYLDHARESKEIGNTKVTVILIATGALGTIPKRIGKGTGRLGNKRTSEDRPDNSIDKIGQNTEKSPGELKRLVVSQTSEENKKNPNFQTMNTRNNELVFPSLCFFQSLFSRREDSFQNTFFSLFMCNLL